MIGQLKYLVDGEKHFNVLENVDFTYKDNGEMIAVKNDGTKHKINNLVWSTLLFVMR